MKLWQRAEPKTTQKVDFRTIVEKTFIQPDGPQLDEHEFIEVDLIRIEQLIDNARNGRMTDLGPVFMAYDLLTELQKEAA